MDKIANVTFMGGRTKTSEAFKFLREQGFSPDVARREVAHIVLTFTDGLSKNPRDTAREAELARRKGIYLFSIGIGMSVEKTELAEIASEPEDDFVFHVANFSVLNTIKDILAIKTCAVDQPEFVADEHRYGKHYKNIPMQYKIFYKFMLKKSILRFFDNFIIFA